MAGMTTASCASRILRFAYEPKHHHLAKSGRLTNHDAHGPARYVRGPHMPIGRISLTYPGTMSLGTISTSHSQLTTDPNRTLMRRTMSQVRDRNQPDTTTCAGMLLQPSGISSSLFCRRQPKGPSHALELRRGWRSVAACRMRGNPRHHRRPALSSTPASRGSRQGPSWRLPCRKAGVAHRSCSPTGPTRVSSRYPRPARQTGRCRSGPSIL